MQHIQAPNALKEAVKQLYRAHCKESLDTASIEQEVLSEYDRLATLAFTRTALLPALLAAAMLRQHASISVVLAAQH